MMDAKLKALLVEAIEKACEETERPRRIGGKQVAQGGVHFAQGATFVCRNRKFFLPKRQKAQAFVFAKVITNLVNARTWGKIERAVAEEAVERMIADFFRRHQRATEDPAQLQLPGFEFLPKRVCLRHQSLAFARITITQFLDYKKWYESHWEKDQRVLEDLRRLAEKVQPFAQKEPDLTVAEALGRAKGTAIRLVAVAPGH
jgi:hypothetical protein